MNAYQHWELEPGDQRRQTLWINTQTGSQNTFSAAVMSEFSAVLEELESQPEISCLVIRSRKANSFFAGADIREFQQIKNQQQAYELAANGQQLFHRLQNLPFPTIAVIEGACLGGGLEMALACRYRLAVNKPETKIGLPEIELGIIPGWGGTQRLTRLVGVSQAIAMILQAHKLTAEKAFRVGLVDATCLPGELNQQLAKLADELESTGKLKRTIPARSWKNWFINETRWGRNLYFSGTEKRIARQKLHYPALERALKAIKLAATETEQGLSYERESIAELVFSTTSQNLVRLFLLREQARDMQSWKLNTTSELPAIKTVGILGGGTMGAGIAFVALKSGYQVVLKEINDEAKNAALERIEQTFQLLLIRKSITPEQVEYHKQALQLTTSWADFSAVDLVVEVVPEVMSLKKEVFQQAAAHSAPGTLYASNTSALSIAEMSTAVESPDKFAGLHFFNPVHRMDLVEVVRTEKTADQTLAQLISVTRKLGKTPVLVRDSPGFLVNRILMPYLDEAVRLAIEMTGVEEDFAMIDREMRQFGMPMGPLELLDQIGLDVAAHVAGSMEIVFGIESITAKLLQRMMDDGRYGRKTSHGFYAYPSGKRGKRIGVNVLLEGLSLPRQSLPITPLDNKLTPIQQRLVLAMVNEAARCLDEKIVDESWTVDLAMVLGTGFPPFHGGPIKLLDTFDRGAVLRTLEILQQHYGPRFQAAEWLKSTASISV